jgi:hypothetical protein
VQFEIEDASGAVHRSDFTVLATADSLLNRAIDDQDLISSNGRLADVRNRGPNPYLQGFPPPSPFHEKYVVPLVRDAGGLLVKAESEYARADAEVLRFMTNNFLPAIRKTMQLDEAVISDVRPARRPSEADLNVHENVTYNVLGERALLLDLYTPKTSPTEPLPVVYFIHGGGWLDGAIGVVSGNWAAFPDKDPWLYNEAVPLFHIIERDHCLPLLFVKAGRPQSVWIEANIADSHSQHIPFRWPHAFECFDPSKDELVDVLAGYVRKVADAQSAQESATP